MATGFCLATDVRLLQSLCADVEMLHGELGEVLDRVETRQGRAAGLLVGVLDSLVATPPVPEPPALPAPPPTSPRKRPSAAHLRDLLLSESSAQQKRTQSAGRRGRREVGAVPKGKGSARKVRARSTPNRATMLVCGELHDKLEEACRHFDLADVYLHKMQHTVRATEGPVRTLVRSAQVLSDLAPRTEAGGPVVQKRPLLASPYPGMG